MPYSRLKRSLRATFVGLGVNTVLACTKFAAGVLGHSQALIADGIESMADVFSSLIVWRGLTVAAAPADEDHPYGHGKAEPIAAAVVALMLLLAAVWIVIQSLHEIRVPHASPAPFTLLVLIVVVIIKESLFRFVLQEAVSVDSSAVKTDAWHHRSDAITSLAAAVGITISLVGGTAYAAADDYAAIAAALVIAWNGARLLRPALNELMDAAPSREVVEQVRAIAGVTPGVERIEKCIVRKMGYNYFVDIHVEVDPEMSVRRSHEIAHAVKDAVRRANASVYDVLVHIEPADYEGKEAKR